MTGEEPQAVCQGPFADVFVAGDAEYDLMTAAPGLTGDELVVDPCDSREYETLRTARRCR